MKPAGHVKFPVLKNYKLHKMGGLYKCGHIYTYANVAAAEHKLTVLEHKLTVLQQVMHYNNSKHL